MIEFNVDTDAVVEFTNKLEKLNNSAFPIAVRGTLNGLAFDIKKNTMPKSSKRFVSRRKNFFKATSRVEMAKGLNVNSMESKVGFLSKNLADQDLEQQEHGGKIKHRSFVPLKGSRVSKNQKRSVSKKNRIKNIRNVVNVSSQKGRNNGQKFLVSVLKAGVGGFILNKNTLFRVKSIREKKGKNVFKLEALYSYEKGRSVKVRATNFMKKATEKTIKGSDDLYIKEAERQFEKALR